jgi:uncharacterized membrane protein (Fun14 family)
MRFKRSDLTGIAVAAFIPAMLSWIFFDGWGLQHHEGTPLLGQMAANFAIVGGIFGYLTRYLAHPRAFRIVLALLGLVFIGVLEMQASGVDNTVWSLAMKWLGVVLFLALNVLLVIDVLAVAVNPYLVRRDERRAAGE